MEKKKDDNRKIVCKVISASFNFACPICGYGKMVEVGNRRGVLDVTCRCRNVTRIILNRRRVRRREVCLPGYIVIGAGRKDEVEITDISLGGICVGIGNLHPGLKVGVEVGIIFSTIYKGEAVEMRLRSIVRSVRSDGKKIGLEYAKPLEKNTIPYKAIGFLFVV